jgi:uncharacterized repeat protein (TIGR04138 family)
MGEIDFNTAMDRVITADPRYRREAYEFVREGLDFTQKIVAQSANGSRRHVRGQELVAGLRDYALAQYGPMALTVLDEWGIRRCEDFGEIVFNLIDAGIFSKTAEDSRDDFKDGYDFTKAFKEPFLPKAKITTPSKGKE